MTLEELIFEAEAISEPAFALCRQPQSENTEIYGYWGGERSDLPNGVTEWAGFKSMRHICTVRDDILQKVGFVNTWTLGLFEYQDKDETLLKIDFPKLEWQKIEFSGEPLYKRPINSFPPLEAVLQYGQGKIENWFQELGLKRYQYRLIREQRTYEVLLTGYAQVHHERMQSNEQDAAIIVGGWHKFWWNDDNYYIPKETPLVFQTLQEAEPWYECFAANDNYFFIKERIT